MRFNETCPSCVVLPPTGVFFQSLRQNCSPQIKIREKEKLHTYSIFMFAKFLDDYRIAIMSFDFKQTANILIYYKVIIS